MQYPYLPPLAYWGLTSSTWVAMWGVLGTITILLIVLLRTRWANKRTWQKCAILSLWVHVIFAFLSVTVRIITGAPETGDDVPIRVAVLPAEAPIVESKPEEEIQPDWEHLAAPPLVAPAADPLPDPIEETYSSTPDTVAMESLAEVTTKMEPSPPAPLLKAPALLPAPAISPASDLAKTEPASKDEDPSPAESAPESSETSQKPPVESIASESEMEHLDEPPDVVP